MEINIDGDEPGSPLVVTADPSLLDRALAVPAAAGVEPMVVPDPGAVRDLWTSATCVLVGVDQAAVLSGAVLPRRLQVYVVGGEESREDACRWSAPLGAAVVVLPDSSAWLSAAVAEASGLRGGTGRVICVVGASGGVGASTLACGLAHVGAQQGRRTLLVDGDPLSGGLDLLMGAERVVGWRWPRLATAEGHLGDLSGHLPRVAGVDVLTTARGPQPAGVGMGATAMKAVVTSARASHDLIIVDITRDLPAPGREALRQADVTAIVAATDLRSVAAARQVLIPLTEAGVAPQLVVRTSRTLGVDVAVVADGLGLPLLATLADDPSVRGGVERSDPPGRVGRGALARACRRILDSVPLPDARAAIAEPVEGRRREGVA